MPCAASRLRPGIIDCHLKQLTRRLSSNHDNNKSLDRKDGRPSITLLRVACSFFQIKMLTTERGLSVQILLIYHTCHHLKQTKCGISQHSNLCHRSSPLITVLLLFTSSIACTVIWCAIVTFLLAVTVTTNPRFLGLLFCLFQLPSRWFFQPDRRFSDFARSLSASQRRNALR